MEGKEWEEGEMNPPSHVASLEFTWITPFGAPLNPFQAHVCVYYPGQETEVLAH